MPKLINIIQSIKARFTLAEDRAETTAIDTEIRSSVVLRGTNLWVLILAMLIASVGLDVNSTAVIIGAMLISPLMGPIIGIGYGIGVYDFSLIRKAASNLAIATLIALLTSTLYFLLSPLSEAHSELLARTSPTIWDVIIAFSGGLAGIIAATRKIKTNVIPGVAIATALMPPLCTAGYGLAIANWHFFFGAFYLFIINCVFIAFAAVIIISAMKLPHKNYVDAKTESRVKKYLLSLVFITVVPSLYLAYNLVKVEVFTQKAKSFVNHEFKFDETFFTNLKVDAKEKKIELSLIGKPLPKDKLESIKQKLSDNGLDTSTLIVHQAGEQAIDTLSLKSSIIADLYKESQIKVEVRDKEIESLKDNLVSYQKEKDVLQSLVSELHALFPEITNLIIANGINSSSQFDIYHQKITVIVTNSQKPLSHGDAERLTAWLKTKLKTENIKLIAELDR